MSEPSRARCPSRGSRALSRPRCARTLGAILALGLSPLVAFAQAPPSAPEVAPQPRVLDALPAPVCPDGATVGERPLGSAPQPGEETLKQFRQFVEQTVDPQNTLDLIVGQPRLLIFKEAPIRIQLGDDRPAGYTVVTQRELSVVGRAPGSTVLNLWFGDPKDPKKQTILSYLVRVLPDAGYKERLESQLKTLQDEINRAFCESVVCLRLVGNKVVVSGQAKDIVEAGQILNVIGVQTGGTNTNTNTNQANRGGINTQGAPIPTTPDAVTPAGTPTTPGSPATPTTDSYIVPNFPNLVNLLRVPGEEQVMLKVVVAEVNRDAARSIGVNFLVENNAGQVVFAQLTGGLTGRGTGNTAGGNGINTGGVNLPLTLDNGKLPVALNALRSLDLARTLAEPDLVTMNGKAANFQAGGSFPVPVLTGTGLTVASGVQFVNFGVQLQFTPVITDRDRIRLQVTANVSDLDPSIGTTINTSSSGTGTFVTGLNTRNFTTTVEMRDGQTLAVAGLIRNDFLSNSQRVPLLGDIPVFSRLWSVNSTSHRDQELVMLVTPVLVHPLGPKEKPPLPGSDVFEPSDLEFYLLGRMESRKDYDYRSGARNDFARMLRYRQCENIYINGPHGHADGK